MNWPWLLSSTACYGALPNLSTVQMPCMHLSGQLVGLSGSKYIYCLVLSRHMASWSSVTMHAQIQGRSGGRLQLSAEQVILWSNIQNTKAHVPSLPFLSAHVMHHGLMSVYVLVHVVEGRDGHTSNVEIYQTYMNEIPNFHSFCFCTAIGAKTSGRRWSK